MEFAKELAAMEAQPSGVGDLPSLEAAAVGRLRQKILKQDGLHVSLDCRDKILAISEAELDETILPFCSWLKGLVEAQGKAAGDFQRSNMTVLRTNETSTVKRNTKYRRHLLFARSEKRAYRRLL